MLQLPLNPADNPVRLAHDWAGQMLAVIAITAVLHSVVSLAP
jgi:hypothetical protein